MKRIEKEEEISSLSAKLKKSKGLLLAEYRGLKVSEFNEIRKELKNNAAQMQVVKNRLVKKAIAQTPWANLESHFRGPLAVVFSEQDPVVISKILSKFSETYISLKLMAGSLGGDVLTAKDIQALAKLPSKEELYAKMLGTLQAPLTGFMRILQAVPQKLVVALKAISEKQG